MGTRWCTAVLFAHSPGSGSDHDANLNLATARTSTTRARSSNRPLWSVLWLAGCCACTWGQCACPAWPGDRPTSAPRPHESTPSMPPLPAGLGPTHGLMCPQLTPSPEPLARPGPLCSAPPGHRQGAHWLALGRLDFVGQKPKGAGYACAGTQVRSPRPGREAKPGLQRRCRPHVHSEGGGGFCLLRCLRNAI